MKFGLRDLIWLIVVAALITVIFTNMFAFQHSKRKLTARLQQQLMAEKELANRLQLALASVEAQAAAAESLRRELLIQADSDFKEAPDNFFGKNIEELVLGKCIRVVDGDSIVCKDGDREFQVQFDLIDCPELDQPYGDQSKKLTSELCLDRELTILTTENAQTGELLGVAFAGQINVTHELLSAGLAWHDKQRSDDSQLSIVEERARNEKKGLWFDDEAFPPWKWRQSFGR